MTEQEKIYRQGYLAGYRDGLAAGQAGKTAEPELPELPLEALGLSARAVNCLHAYNCRRVADVARLSAETIGRMRGLGKLTADEIARSLHAHEVLLTAWDAFLL